MSSNIPDIWGGIECSYTRTNNKYGDQLHYCGHYRRGKVDLQQIACLGVKTLRYPIIWERNWQDNNWLWVERQLNMLKRYEITPIVGLVHHGCGPNHATLPDPAFATELEKYATCVAQKFPYLQYFTPINEPLTTARFSGLYGIWYPHRRDAKSFAKIFLRQMKAIVLSMGAIRKINPNAKLIQTEDLGKTYSTTLLQYQADFENERRWLTNDLLLGYVKPGHPMWDYFLWIKTPQKHLEFFLENPCRPDMIGIDYYPTSERFLDENIEGYPESTHGTNGKHVYADMEALRVNHKKACGPLVLFNECWKRYHIPLAITEVHIHGSPFEQISWFNYIREKCLQLIRTGVDIQAITAWAMFGAFGWSKLLTENPGEYERGVFEINNGNLVSTPYTEYLKALIKSPETTCHSDCDGWWTSPSRYIKGRKATHLFTK
jgi:dTDP-4-dehydrorhamnose reductase